MLFVTRERIHVDGIATAWAIRRFIDAAATFEYVSWRTDIGNMSAIPLDGFVVCDGLYMYCRQNKQSGAV